MKLVPMEDRAIIEPIVQQEKSPGGIIIPPTAMDRPQIGNVLAVGKGKLINGKRIAPELKVGDMVFYSKFGGLEAVIDGKEFLIIKESDVLAKIE